MAPADIVATLNAVESNQFTSEVDRFAVKEAARRLLARVETPFEQSWAIAFENPGVFAGLQLVQDLGIWKKWAEVDKQNPGQSKTLDELLGWATEKCEPNLLRRFLRHLAALYLINETAKDAWKPSTFSLALGQQEAYSSDVIKAGYVPFLDSLSDSQELRQLTT